MVVDMLGARASVGGPQPYVGVCVLDDPSRHVRLKPRCDHKLTGGNAGQQANGLAR